MKREILCEKCHVVVVGNVDLPNQADADTIQRLTRSGLCEACAATTSPDGKTIVNLPAPTPDELTEAGRVTAQLFDPTLPDPTLAEQVHALTVLVQQLSQQV